MRSLRVPVGVLIAVVLVGMQLGREATTVRGADVPNEGGNAARTGEQAGPGPAGPPGVLWEAQTAERGGTSGRAPQPVSAAGVVLQAGGSQLVPLDSAAGTELWRRDDVEDVSPAITGDIVVIPSRYGSGQGYFYGLDLQTGEERWRFDAKDTPIDVSPVAANGVVYVLSWENTGWVADTDTFLFAVDAASGRPRWRYEVKGLVTTTPAVGSSVVVLGIGESGEKSGIAAVRLRDGKEAWRHKSDHLLPIEYSAVVDGTVLGTTPTGMIALDEETGDQLWEAELYKAALRNAQGNAPAAAEGLAYRVGPDETLRALRLADGAEQWTHEGALSAPVIAAGVLYVSTADGLTALDAASGALLWSAGPLSVNGVVVREVSPPALVDGVAFIGVASHVGTHLFALAGQFILGFL